VRTLPRTPGNIGSTRPVSANRRGPPQLGRVTNLPANTLCARQLRGPVLRCHGALPRLVSELVHRLIKALRVHSTAIRVALATKWRAQDSAFGRGGGDLFASQQMQPSNCLNYDHHQRVVSGSDATSRRGQIRSGMCPQRNGTPRHLQVRERTVNQCSHRSAPEISVQPQSRPNVPT
jgi:hypothetical protein